MDAIVPVRSRLAFPTPWIRICAAGIGHVASVLLVVTTAVLVARRYVGGLQTPLATPTIIWAALMLSALSALVHWSLGARRDSAEQHSRRLPLWAGHIVPALCLMASGAAISLTGTPVVGVLALWGILLAEEAVCGVIAWSNRPGRSVASGVDQVLPPAKPRELRLADDETADESTEEFPDEVSRQIRRGQTDDDRDCCYGWVRSVFAPSQRTETIHVSFCPPFPMVPELMVEHREGPPAQVKIAQVLPYGVRLEVRLSEAHPQTVHTVVEFTAIERERVATAG